MEFNAGRSLMMHVRWDIVIKNLLLTHDASTDPTSHAPVAWHQSPPLLLMDKSIVPQPIIVIYWDGIRFHLSARPYPYHLLRVSCSRVGIRILQILLPPSFRNSLPWCWIFGQPNKFYENIQICGYIRELFTIFEVCPNYHEATVLRLHLRHISHCELLLQWWKTMVLLLFMECWIAIDLLFHGSDVFSNGFM